MLFKNEKSLLDAVVYHCQQSVQKSLKAYLTYQNTVFRKIHNLDILMDLCCQSENNFKDLKDVGDTLVA